MSNKILNLTSCDGHWEFLYVPDTTYCMIDQLHITLSTFETNTWKCFFSPIPGLELLELLNPVGKEIIHVNNGM